MLSIWTEQENNIIRDNRSTHTIKQLATLLPGRSIEAIKVRAHKLGVRAKEFYTYDVNAFSALTPISAYWAGFLAADGCIINNNKGVQLSIAVKDTEHIKRYKEFLRYTGPIETTQKNTNILVTVRLHSAQDLVEDLSLIYNITPRKSLTLQPPNTTSPELLKAYIAGYIDGDGSIHLHTYQRQHRYKLSTYTDLVFQIYTGSIDLADWLYATINSIAGITKTSKIRKSRDTYMLAYGCSVAHKALIPFYNKDLPLLERKWSNIDIWLSNKKLQRKI